MADNIYVDPGTGTGKVPVATDDVGGTQYQIIKIATGGDGAATVISNANPLPMSGNKVVGDAANMGDPGFPALGFRVDTTGAISTAVGEYTVLRVDAQGKLWTAAVQSGTWNIGAITTAVTVNGISTTAPDRGAGAATAQTLRVVLASEQVEAGEYEDVAASQASTTLGPTGSAGDFLSSITFFPESLNPGAVTLQDGALTAITVFFGGTASVSNLVPFTINFGNTSVNGAWKVVTGAAIHIRASGNFT